MWRADLRATSDATLRWLASDERARAARFPVAARGRLWAHARGVLRALLGAYLEEDPRALRFEADAGGKPRLAGHPDRAISFNLSHSGSHALFAFARAGAVGIDIECARPGTDRLALAARAFGPSAARRLRTLEDSEREREFLAMWVRREALVKCMGTSLLAAPS